MATVHCDGREVQRAAKTTVTLEHGKRKNGKAGNDGYEEMKVKDGGGTTKRRVGTMVAQSVDCPSKLADGSSRS